MRGSHSELQSDDTCSAKTDLLKTRRPSHEPCSEQRMTLRAESLFSHANRAENLTKLHSGRAPVSHVNEPI